jgi:hypothetical protein
VTDICERTIVRTIRARTPQLAGNLVRMSDNRTVKNLFLGLVCTESAKRCSNRAEDTSVWAVMLQETAVRLRGLCASEGEEEEEEQQIFVI